MEGNTGFTDLQNHQKRNGTENMNILGNVARKSKSTPHIKVMPQHAKTDIHIKVMPQHAKTDIHIKVMPQHAKTDIHITIY